MMTLQPYFDRDDTLLIYVHTISMNAMAAITFMLRNVQGMRAKIQRTGVLTYLKGLCSLCLGGFSTGTFILPPIALWFSRTGGSPYLVRSCH